MEIKALIKNGGISLLQKSISALLESGAVDKIALIAPEEIKDSLESEVIDHFIPADASGVENEQLDPIGMTDYLIQGERAQDSLLQRISCRRDNEFLGPRISLSAGQPGPEFGKERREP